MAYNEPWSKRHKKVAGGLPFNLSTSFAEPLRHEELIELSLARGDHGIVEQYNNHSLDYTDNGGSLDLREEVAGFYGPEISAENIIIFAGGQVALQTAAVALLDRTSHTIVFGPGYQSVQYAPLHAGSDTTMIELRPEHGWQVDPGKVEAAIKDNTKYIVINEPYNPAGTLMSHKVQRELKEIAAINDIYILSDEAYRLLEHDEKDRLAPMADFYVKGLSTCAMSKPWGGCGITIGWIALQDLELKEKIIDTQYFGASSPSRASEIQAIMALRASDLILKKNIKIIKHNKALLDDFVEKYNDLFEWIRPNAAAIAYMKFKGPLTSEQLGAKLAGAGISIKPAYVFSDGCDYDTQYFRIGFGEKTMPKALEALSQFVENHKEEWGA